MILRLPSVSSTHSSSFTASFLLMNCNKKAGGFASPGQKFRSSPLGPAIFFTKTANNLLRTCRVFVKGAFPPIWCDDVHSEGHLPPVFLYEL